LQTGWSQVQGPLVWALILGPTFLPPALHFLEKTAQNKLSQVGADGFFHGGHFVSKTAMGQIKKY